MKIEGVRGNNRRRAFEVALPGRGTLFFPYARSDPPPSPEDPIVSLFVDPELGNEGLTYRLRSGQEGSVLADHVLEYNRDPSYMRDLLLQRPGWLGRYLRKIPRSAWAAWPPLTDG